MSSRARSVDPGVPLKTIIFDFDGTLVDTFASIFEIANRIAPEFGYRPVMADEIDTLRRWPYRKISSHLGVAWHKLPAIAARIRTELSGQLEHLPLVPGVAYVLSKLQAQGLELGILTSNARENVERFLVARGIEEFAFVDCSSSLWGKRHRLKSLLERQGRTVDEVAYVGDEVRDIEAAQALGIVMVAVTWGFTHPELLAAHAPSHLVEHPLDLLDVFARPPDRSL